MNKRERLFTVEMGASAKQDGKTYHRYTVMGPSGEVMRGARAGKKTEVKKYAQRFADKLESGNNLLTFHIKAA